MKFNTLLFDLDGTLIDTNPLIVESFTHTFKVHFPEMKLSIEEIKTFIGPTLEQTFSRYVDTDVEVKAMMKTYRDHNLSNHEGNVHAYENVHETLTYLKDKGYNMAIVTSKMEDSAELGMKVTGVDQYFDILIGAHAVKEHKPHPEGIKKAIKLFDNVDGVIMIGDNVSDILAGQNADVATAGVKWAFKGSEALESLNPDYMLENIKDLIAIIEEE
jgi:pyrophosphatase PpaX